MKSITYRLDNFEIETNDGDEFYITMYETAITDKPRLMIDLLVQQLLELKTKVDTIEKAI